MKALVLATLLVASLTASVPAFATTPVYNSKAAAPVIQYSPVAISESMAFDGRSTNPKLGSPRAGTISLDVIPAAFRAECTKCSS